ncbi:carboxyl-terminal-processing peptidase 2, chloroplastic [Tanacetum coccineum]
MEVVTGSCSSSSGVFLISCRKNLNNNSFTPQKVVRCNSLLVTSVKSRLCDSISCISVTSSNRLVASKPKKNDENNSFFWLVRKFNARFALHHVVLFRSNERILTKLRKHTISLRKLVKSSEKLKDLFPIFCVRIVLGMMLFMAVTAPVTKSPSWALTEENLLFLEAWRTIDRAYVDKGFNGQSWFRYRENALRNEPMNNREQTYAAIKKMLATLDDPFTRFLEPEKFKSLRSGTQGALTGVGLSIGYPTGNDGALSGLMVISASPGGPASRAAISPGDLIMEINDTSTETMDIYDAAERLQGPEGTEVQLKVRSGSEIKQLVLTRENISLNPVKSRVCETPGLGKGASKIGYIKLTSFNQNASGMNYSNKKAVPAAVKEAIETLRREKVDGFVLDLRNNSGGLFPEGIEIAKIWLDKGVIVYICDSRGVRDIYDTDGTNAIAASEPLAVLVNKGTASASEILAGALKDNKRAVLLGEPTFGKGKIQSVFQMSDGSGLAVTVARYETPDHIDINKVRLSSPAVQQLWTLYPGKQTANLF